MHSLEIQKLVSEVTEKYGEIEYYGFSNDEEYSICFKITGISATFSISTLAGKLKKTYDIQVEGIPAGDYVFTTEVTLAKLIELIDTFRKAEINWP